MARPRFDNLPAKRKCMHPGCEAMLHRRDATYDAGLCKAHGGVKVGKAWVRGFVPIPPKPDRPGIREVEITRAAYSGSTAESGVMRVSLPREPWA